MRVWLSPSRGRENPEEREHKFSNKTDITGKMDLKPFNGYNGFMKKVCFSLIFLIFSSCAHSTVEKRFFCDYFGVPLMSTGNSPNEYFDRVFSYTESDGAYTADLVEGRTAPAKFKDDTLYVYSVDFKGQREGFTVYRFHLNTSELFRSYVFHTSREDYNKHHKPSPDEHPWKIPLSPTPLKYVDAKLPENFIKFGYDKSKWQCHEVSHFKYLLHRFGVALMQILGA